MAKRKWKNVQSSAKDSREKDDPIPKTDKETSGKTDEQFASGTDQPGSDVEMDAIEEEEKEAEQSDEQESLREDEAQDEEKEKPANFSALVGIGEHSDESDSDAPLEAIALSKLPSETIEMVSNDAAALEKKLSEIALFVDIAGKKALPFEESLVVVMPNEKKLSDKLALDDLEREKAFAEMTTEAVHLGLDRLREKKVKFRRPGDYFAEMVKADIHMAKVKTRVLQQKERIEDAEKRRNNRDIKKGRKKVRGEQLEREQEKKRKAKEEIATYSRLRKDRLKEREQGKNDNDDDDDDFPIDLLEVEQLDSDNRFQKHSDIVKGKKQPWRATSGTRGKRSRTDIDGKRGRRSNRTDSKESARGSKKHGSRTPRANGGVKKPRGKKKRLGRSRRMAAQKS
ncbi:unnamed protein product [Agarophyton chilense]